MHIIFDNLDVKYIFFININNIVYEENKYIQFLKLDDEFEIFII